VTRPEDFDDAVRRSGPQAGEQPRSLRTVADLTPALLSELLRLPAGQAVVEARVRRVHQGTSTHVHLDLEYAGGAGGGAGPGTEGPRQVFVKTQLSTVADLPPGFEAALGDGGSATSMLLAEQRFYRQIAPVLDIETLRVFASERLAGAGVFIILTEDLQARPVTFPDPSVSQPPSQVAALLTTLARLHAPAWDSPELRSAGSLAWLDAPLEGPFHDFLRAEGWPLIRVMLEAPYKKRLLADAGLDADTAESLFWRSQAVAARGPHTLLHGNPHPGNVYVLPSGAVGVLDWQLVRRGSWVHDVGYALVAALDPDDRRRHERELLAGYLADLRAAGVEDAPGLDEAFECYRTSPPWGLAMWSITPGEMYSDTIVEAVLARFVAAGRDLGSAQVLSRA